MLRILPKVVAVAVLASLFLAPRFTRAIAAPQDAAPPPISWTDLRGRVHGATDLAAGKATVFVFVSMECPIAVRYAPRVQRLAGDYAGRGVSFFLVDSNIGDDATALAKWGRERGLTLPLVKDAGTALADRLNASITPEAAVVTPDGAVVYRGRIDDSPDGTRVTRHDLADALDDVLAGRPVRRSRVLSLGCAIFRDKLTDSRAPKSRYTWAQDVAPILDRNCVVCHRQGDVAPFPLNTYEQAKLWSAVIKDYTRRRLMPPWKAQPGYGDFQGAHYLTDQQIATIAEWADGGMPKGNVKAMPAPVTQPYAPGAWALGPPDVVVKPVAPYHLEADGKDVYRDFGLPIDFNEDRYVSAFDFRPGNRSIVHHMIAYIDVDGTTVAAKDNRESEPGWPVSGSGSGIAHDEWGDGWAPGMNPRRLPEGVAVRIPRGARLVLQVHYHKSGKPEADQSELAIYWAKAPVTKVFHTAAMGNMRFVLPANVANQTVQAEMTLPGGADLYQILPHMHMLGTAMRVWATLPDGSEKRLIYVKDWDFNWQMSYRYRQPIYLPKGTQLHLVATYDNTAANPRQPSNPPRTVTYGEQTTDEMCFAFLGFTTDDGAADRHGD